MPRAPIVVAFVVVAWLVAAAAPLWAYGLSLATFGLAHVLYELRYVDGRFGARIPVHMRWVLLVALGILVLGRVGGVAGWFPFFVQSNLELTAGAVLAFSVVPALWPRASGIFAAALALAIVAGMAFVPMHTFLLIAVAHNLTPIGFLAESRGRMPWGLAALFVLGPLSLASGLPQRALGVLGLYGPDWTWLPTGVLDAHLGAYLPKAWHAHPWAAWAFSGVVFSQLLHYAVVIHVLPNTPGQEPTLRWPKHFPRWVVGASMLLFAGFTVAFDDTRSIYGIAAILHAWIEVPILLLALGGLAPAVASPAPQ